MTAFCLFCSDQKLEEIQRELKAAKEREQKREQRERAEKIEREQREKEIERLKAEMNEKQHGACCLSLGMCSDCALTVL